MTAYMGASNLGETFYYAESPDGTEGVMVVLDPETNNYVSFVGPVSNPSSTQVTITDESTGNTLTFEVTAAEGNAIAIDLGEQGSAVLAECSPQEVIEAFATINEYSNAVA